MEEKREKKLREKREMMHDDESCSESSSKKQQPSVLAPLLAPFPFNGATIIWVVCIGAIPSGGSRCLLGSRKRKNSLPAATSPDFLLGNFLFSLRYAHLSGFLFARRLCFRTLFRDGGNQQRHENGWVVFSSQLRLWGRLPAGSYGRLGEADWTVYESPFESRNCRDITSVG